MFILVLCTRTGIGIGPSRPLQHILTHLRTSSVFPVVICRCIFAIAFANATTITSTITAQCQRQHFASETVPFFRRTYPGQHSTSLLFSSLLFRSLTVQLSLSLSLSHSHSHSNPLFLSLTCGHQSSPLFVCSRRLCLCMCMCVYSPSVRAELLYFSGFPLAFACSIATCV
ncbi:hypothetical protein FIM1_4488 [Kluyveromyces marxianus]|uniref:Uncharacterized protein n=1 Tax=Kluyveromyces marxianus TaxID=4911 RepID=A0ABX6F0P5_KLUMA|nr:hypothetical protein FIM1_4488 [Kluyveromyces marxianus]